MNAELSAALGISAAGAIALAATPLAIAIARRTGFYDVPRGYRSHAAPTPLLGGTAVLAALIAAALVTGTLTARVSILLGCAAGLWLLGSVDDRIGVPPIWRLLAEFGAAVALYAGGLGWRIGLAGAVEVVLTVIWVVGLVNAFNLMDNLDGACATVGCICGAGIGALAVIYSQAAIAGVAFGLSGACAGFLPYNLARPSKIFLGDGGSMPVGFLVAGLAMLTAHHLYVGDSSLLAAAMLTGLPILDTTLVSVSRIRRGVALTTGGRDHLTHRLLSRLGSPRAVAACLALIQLLLCGAAIAGERLGSAAVYTIGGAAFIVGVAAISVLDSPRWRPSGIATDARRSAAAPSSVPGVRTGQPEIESLGVDQL